MMVIQSDRASLPRSAGWWRSQPIERRLPVAFAAVLAIIVAFYTYAAYREVESSATDAALARLQQVGSQIVQTRTGNQQRITNVQRQLDRPEIQQLLASGGRNDSVLSFLTAAGDTQSVLLLNSAMEIASERGPRLSATAEQELRLGAPGALQPGTPILNGRLFEDDGRVAYWQFVPLNMNGDTGIFAQLRPVTGTPNASSRAIQSLIGDATVLIANANGAPGPWLTLEYMRTTPPADFAADTGSQRYVRAGVEYLAHVTPLSGTAWLIVTETPVATASGRARAFVERTLPFAVVVIALGSLLAWLVGRNYTRPLAELATAARAIGSGEYKQRVNLRQGGDLGEMADAFNRMSEQVERTVSERTAELQRVNHELQAFSYSVSHDLRSPLRSIDGFSQALLEDYGKQLDETAQDYLRRVRAGAQRMGQLIDDLLMLSRVSRQPITRVPVNLSDVAMEELVELRQQEPTRVAEITIQPDLVVQGDAGLLRVAMQNLLGNAWKFSSKKETTRIEVGSREDNGERTVYVRDNGAGFDMQYASQLFAPFQRMHSSATFSGTGIGLATVNRIITRHGGRVWAESTPGGGAVFQFTVGEETDGI